MCTFYGVTCDASSHAPVSVNLGGNALRGTLPSSLSALTTLLVLNLEANYLYGRLPASLAWLPLSNYTGKVVQNGNSYTVQPFPTLGLFLGGNALSGPLPANWASWPARARAALYNPNLYATSFSGSSYAGPYIMLSLARAQNNYAAASNWVNQICGPVPDEYTSGMYGATFRVDFMHTYSNGNSVAMLPPCPVASVNVAGAAPPISALFSLPAPGFSESGYSGTMVEQTVVDGSNNVYTSSIQASGVTLSPQLPLNFMNLTDGNGCAGMTASLQNLNGLLFKLSSSGTPAWAVQAGIPCSSVAPNLVTVDDATGTLYWSFYYALPMVSCESCTSGVTCTVCPSTNPRCSVDGQTACYSIAANLTFITTYPGQTATTTFIIPLSGVASGTLLVAISNNGVLTNWSFTALDDLTAPAEITSPQLAGLQINGSSGALTIMLNQGLLIKVNSSTKVPLWNVSDTSMFDTASQATVTSTSSPPYQIAHNGMLMQADGSVVYCGTVADPSLQQSSTGPLLLASNLQGGSLGQSSAFLARVNSTGSTMWAMPVCSPSPSSTVLAYGYCTVGDSAPPTLRSVAADASGSLFVVGTMMGVRNCTAQGDCANQFTFGGNTSVSFTAEAVSPYGVPLPTDGVFDTSLRQVFQHGFVAKFTQPTVGQGMPAVQWVLPIISNDFIWAPGCDQGLPALSAWIGDLDGAGAGCSSLLGASLVGGTRVFAVTADASDGSVIITGHTVFNASFALPASSTAGAVTFGLGAGAPSLQVPATAGTFSFPPWPRTTGITWVAKVSASGTALWAKVLGPPKPEGVPAPDVQVGRSGSLTFVGTGTVAAANAGAAAGRRLLDASADQSTMVVIYDSGDAAPAAVAYVQLNLTLSGLVVDDFTAAAQSAFTATVAAALRVAPTDVTISSFSSSAPAARRRLHAAQANALVVTIAVAANSTAAATAMTANAGSALSGTAFVAALNAAFSGAGVTQQVTGIKTVVASPNGAATSSSLKCSHSAVARALLATSALLLTVATTA